MAAKNTMPMTKKELLKALENVEDDAKIILHTKEREAFTPTLRSDAHLKQIVICRPVRKQVVYLQSYINC